MAAVSAWGKPSSWALEAEEQDATNALQEKSGYSSSDSHQSNDFPSLSMAAAAKIPKKKKNKTLSLAEFNAVGSAAALKAQPIFFDETLNLPTAPRERTAEEIQNSRYGRRGEDSSSRWGNSNNSRVSDESSRRGPREPREPLGPSRADEVDDWGKTKKAPAGFDRRESGSNRGGSGFFGESRADESDSWVSKKGAAPPMGGDYGRRERRGYDLFNRDGSGADSGSWGRRREDGANSSGRPRIVLQPRTLPIENVVVSSNGNGEVKSAEAAAVGGGSKGVNPFGGARPREEVLKEKGKDWKEIDKKLENVKIQEVGVSNGRRDFGRADKTERAWRKPVADEGMKPQIEEDKSSSRTNSLEEQTTA